MSLPDGVDHDRRRRGPWSLGRRVDDRKWPRFARDLWLLTITGIALIAVLNSATASHQATRVAKRVATDEQTTCQIQARGLPAGHELAASMQGIYALLTLPAQSKAQKLAAKNEPESVHRVVASLDQHLAAYLKAEARQPQTRACR